MSIVKPFNNTPTTTVTTDVNLVGLWEGAYFRATGFYRPVYDSKMRSLGRPFGPANLRAYSAQFSRIEESVSDERAKRIRREILPDDTSPGPRPLRHFSGTPTT